MRFSKGLMSSNKQGILCRNKLRTSQYLRQAKWFNLLKGRIQMVGGENEELLFRFFWFKIKTWWNIQKIKSRELMAIKMQFTNRRNKFCKKSMDCKCFFLRLKSSLRRTIHYLNWTTPTETTTLTVTLESIKRKQSFFFWVQGLFQEVRSQH